jgi:tmRNA-binding protein
MDTCPDFNGFLSEIENKSQKKDALSVLKHTWGQLDKQDQKGLYCLFSLYALKDKQGDELQEYKKMLHEHPEIIERFNHFYTKVMTPVSAKDHFKNDRIKAATGLEKGIKELQHKHLIKSFEIKRVA